MISKQFTSFIILFVCAFSLTLFIYFFYPKQNSSIFTKKEIEEMSENVGHLLANDLQEYAPYYDLNVVINTLKKIQKEEIELKTTEECYPLLIDTRYRVIEKESQDNLIAAEMTIEELSKNNSIKELINKKLYYEIIEPGDGPLVDDNSTPLLQFKETYLNNQIVRGTSKPIRIKLSETLAGFKKGVSGMHVGEKRKIYVHPDLTYGKLARQQLSIFDVEIINE